MHKDLSCGQGAEMSNHVTDGYVDVSGGHIYYQTAGIGQPVVFIHSDFLDCRMWERQFHTLARRFHVIRYDALGYGRSQDAASDDQGRDVDNLRMLMEHLGITRPFLVGHGAGYQTAQKYAVAFPDDAQGVVAIAPAAIENPLQVADSPELALDLPSLEATVQSRHVAPILLRMIKDQWGRSSTPDLVTTMSAQTAHEHFGINPLPGMVVVGEWDGDEHHAMAETLIGSVSSFEKAVIRRTGHLPNMEDHRAFNRVLVDFFDKSGSYSPVSTYS